MLYDQEASYNQSYFTYNGIRVLEPSSFGPTSNIGDINVVKVLVLHPDAINPTLVFIPLKNIVIQSGSTQVTESLAFISFDTYDSGYIAFSVNAQDSYAVSSAKTIILEGNSAGTVDVILGYDEDGYAVSSAESVALEGNSAGNTSVTIIPTA